MCSLFPVILFQKELNALNKLQGSCIAMLSTFRITGFLDFVQYSKN
jgi:hypothetical protein